MKDETNDAGYRLDDQVGFLMRRANQRHLAIFARAIAGLTPTQFAALAKLHEVGPISQNDLGRRIAMDAATMKGVIDRLRARALVSTRPDPDDRRRRTISLTEAGEAEYRTHVAAAAAISEDTLEPLDPAERTTFLALLRRMAG